MVSLAEDDIQGNILRGYHLPKGVHLFFTIRDVQGARAFLGTTAREVMPATDWDGRRPAKATNVALTYSGLRALGVDEAILSTLPTAFREPMDRRAPRVLGDIGKSAPECWDKGLGTGTAHILVLVAGRGNPLEKAVAKLVRRAKRHKLEQVFRQDVADLPGRREHFGWADGLGQPAVEGVNGKQAGGGIPEPFGQWRALKAGEFVHGYPDEADHVLSGPATPLLRNGSFMVYRKLEQNVAAFRAKLYDEARAYAEVHARTATLDQVYELMAAKVVGRWRDGKPIVLHPSRAEHDLGDRAPKKPGNNFRYGDDPDGLVCPKGAHIRRANPRDADGADGTAAARHRIIRRGVPYGKYVRRARLKKDDGTRGLIFICFNADFERQFETIQARWCNDGNAFGLGDDRDYLLASSDGSGKMTIPGRPPYFVEAQPEIVLTRGCEYLLMPGINALRDLAGSRFGRP